MNLFNELKRRNVFKVGIAYTVASWLLLQLSDILVPLLELPESVQKLILLLLIIGFVPSLILAWAFEMTPEGIKKEKDVDREQSITPKTGRKLDFTIIGMLLVVLSYFVWEARFSADRGSGSIAPDKPVQTNASVNEQLNLTPLALVVEDKSIAVLPFVNMSSDPEQEYFSDGLAEELLNRLAKNDQLRVAARTSAFQFKGRNLDITEIGRQLKVAHLLEGSVRKSGNRLRITAQLIRVDTGFHLWSETYEREIDDIFAIQDEISLAISTALEIELGTASTTTGQSPTNNLEAYNHYLRARFFLAERGADNMLKARELFNQAVSLDPEFSAAWSGMAFNSALLASYSYNLDRKANFEQTMLAANRALELDPSNGEAYTAIGRVQAEYLLDWHAAQTSFERAYAFEPNSISVLNLYGDFLSTVGAYKEAMRLETRLMDLDPLAAVHATDLAGQFLDLNRNQEALDTARISMRLAPDSYARISPLVVALIRSDAFDEARALIEYIRESLPGNAQTEVMISEWWAYYYYQQNDVEKLREIIATAISASTTSTGESVTWSPGMIAFFTLWLDGVDAALPWLEKAYTERDFNLTWSWFFYLPERISDDPAWLEFWKKPGLRELLDMRRTNPHANVGFWKERPAQ